jgi:hypothetical protein
MNIRTNYKTAIATSMLLLTASQVSLVQAADDTAYNQAPQPAAQGYAAPQMQQPQSTQGYGAPQMQQPQATQGYGYVPTDNLTPGYTQPYYQGGNRGRDYGRGHNSSPWGGSSPSFSGPWNSGRGGNSMPWSGGRGGNGPSFSGPWDGGRGNSMPWDSGRGGNSMPWSGGRGGNSPSFSGPWDSGRGSGMSW